MKLSFLKIQRGKGKEKHSLSTMIEISKSKGREVLSHATLLQKVFMDMCVRHKESTHMSKAAIRRKDNALLNYCACVCVEIYMVSVIPLGKVFVYFN